MFMCAVGRHDDDRACRATPRLACDVEYVAGFLSAALVAIIAAAVGIWFTARHERGRQLAERRQRIYMMLLDLKQEHFWISSGDMPMPDREIPPESKKRYWEGCWKVADELRAADSLRQLPGIVDALFSLRFEHEWQRADAIGKVIEDLGRDVNPRFVGAMRQRDREAMELVGKSGEEWMRRRGKIEPFFPTPTERQRATTINDTDGAGETD